MYLQEQVRFENELRQQFIDDDDRLDQFIKEAQAKKYEGYSLVNDSIDKFKEFNKRNNIHSTENKKLDPLIIFGVGIWSFFKLIKRMGLILIMLSILSMASISILRLNVSSKEDISNLGFFQRLVYQTSFAQLPEADSECLNRFVSINKNITLNCKDGHISAETLNYGLILSGAAIDGNNNTPAYNDYCGEQSRIPAEFNCYDQIKHE